jgi:SH3-like domain-containing protein
MTNGFFVFGISSQPRRIAALPSRGAPIQPSLTVLAHTAFSRVGGETHSFSYQMAVTTQSFRTALCRLALVASFVAMQGSVAWSAGDGATGSVSGLPIPRFVSLKSDRVNARSGPNKDQEVRWVYTHVGMPVEITAEFENWRRIRDWEGAEGWVYHTLLSGKRMGVVVPKSKEELVPLHENANVESAVTARLQSGVLGALKSCDGRWCQFSGKGFEGYIQQERLWGAYPNEKVD